MTPAIERTAKMRKYNLMITDVFQNTQLFILQQSVFLHEIL